MTVPSPGSPSRRTFLAASASVAATALLPGARAALVHPAGRSTLRVGVIGCGGRGGGAALNALDADEGTEIWALGDLFLDRAHACRQELAKRGARADVPIERVFAGFDAARRVLQSGVDLVILATPPGFRPSHIQAAVEAGKHVFAEKPVAVDAPGVRMVIEAGATAQAKGLGFVAGTQRRHQRAYLETMQRIADGAIGEIVSGSCHWNQGGLWVHERKPDYSDVEWQIRNWLYFTWLSGDHIVEQHVHNLDVMNWALGGPPRQASGMGGRQCRTDPRFGHVFDHFAIEYEYASGTVVSSYCRQIDGTDGRVGERLVGTQGTADPGGRIEGPAAYRHRGQGDPDPYVQEHRDLIGSIRAGAPLNEARRIAESTLTAIMGRMAAYSGKVVTYDAALASEDDLMPSPLAFGDLPVPAVAIPGRTPLR